MKQTANNELPVDPAITKKAALVFRAVNHKLRQDIMRLIQKKDKITVTEIYTKLKLEQSVASQHLAILRQAGFVNTERDGKFIYYSIDPERLQRTDGIAAGLLSRSER
jgi:DNA-binding transcriptional ArsR family regulator